MPDGRKLTGDDSERFILPDGAALTRDQMEVMLKMKEAVRTRNSDKMAECLLDLGRLSEQGSDYEYAVRYLGLSLRGRGRFLEWDAARDLVGAVPQVSASPLPSEQT